MAVEPLTLLAALAPLVVDAGKAAASRWLTPDEFKPSTVEQYTAMRQIDLAMFKAMNEAGGSNPSYPWVEAVVRLMRPAVGLTVLGTWAVLHLAGVHAPEVDNFASIVGFYLFGDRTLFYARKAVK